MPPVALNAAMTQAHDLQAKYLQATNDQVLAAKLVNFGFLGAGATAIGGALFGGHRDLVTGAAREPAAVEAELRASFEEIWSVAGHASLPDSRWSTLRKAEAMIPAMTATLAFVQGLIVARTAALALPAAALACVRTLLIPGLYLARQAAQQKGREARATLRARSAELLQEAAASASWAVLARQRLK